MKLSLLPRADLRGRRVLVTGASMGIGRALAEAFLKEGARVAACARHPEALGALARAGALTAAADVSEPSDVERLVALARERWGGLDAVVNNAAVLELGALLEQDLSAWRRTLDVNVTGCYLVAREAARVMEAGSIVNVSSGLARFTMAPYHAYSVSKAALEMLTLCLAQELEGRIVVNALDPGGIRSRMNPEAPNEPEAVVDAARALAALGPGGPTGRVFKRDGSEAPARA